MTDRHGFHDHYGKDRPKDTDGKNCACSVRLPGGTYHGTLLPCPFHGAALGMYRALKTLIDSKKVREAMSPIETAAVCSALLRADEKITA